MKLLLQAYWNDETGQDLIEYALLLGFVVLGSAALFIGAGTSVSGVWDEGSELLHSANKSAS